MLLVLALTMLTHCSKVLSIDDVPAAHGQVDYRYLIATDFKSVFKDKPYSGVEISAPRMVDSIYGRASLTCLRFELQGRRRFYVFLVKNDAIVEARYDVETDGCPAQAYQPFDLNAGLEGRMTTAAPQNPLY
jgi:hypothetical protein